MAFSPWNTSQTQYNIPVSSAPQTVNGVTYNVQYDQNGTPISALDQSGTQAMNMQTGQAFTPASQAGGLGGFLSNITSSPIPLAAGLMGAGLMGLGSGAAAAAPIEASAAPISAAAPAAVDAGLAGFSGTGLTMGGGGLGLTSGGGLGMTAASPGASAIGAGIGSSLAGAGLAGAAGGAALGSELASMGGGGSLVAPAAAAASVPTASLLGSNAANAATAAGVAKGLTTGQALGLGAAGAGLLSNAGSTSSLPGAPDYKAAAEATAAAGRVNQVNPYGSMSYAQTGTDAQGNPIYTQTTTLSPAQQQLLDQQNKTSLGLGGSIDQSLGYVSKALANPFDTSVLPAQQINPGQTAQDAIMARLNPQFDRRQAALETQLANQGIARGTEAWNAAQTDLNNARNDASTQAALQGINLGQQARQQALQEQSFLRQEPINTLNSLRTGATVNNPQFGSTPGGANYSNAAQQQYNANLGAYNANQMQKTSTNNGLFGLGSAFLGSTAGSNMLNNLFGG